MSVCASARGGFFPFKKIHVAVQEQQQKKVSWFGCGLGQAGLGGQVDGRGGLGAWLSACVCGVLCCVDVFGVSCVSLLCVSLCIVRLAIVVSCTLLMRPEEKDVGAHREVAMSLNFVGVMSVTII